MHKLIDDFDLTVLWPLIAVSLVLLWHSVRRYATARNSFGRAEKRLIPQIRAGAVEADLLDWHTEAAQEKRGARGILQISLCALGVLLVLSFTNDPAKLRVAWLVWKFLAFANSLACFAAICTAWYYVRKKQWLYLGACVLVLVLTMSSMEHLLHQNVNSSRIVCPDCDDSDRPDDY